MLFRRIFFFFIGLVTAISFATPQKIVRVGYYESPFFQEGAADGLSMRGYAYDYYQHIAQFANWKYKYVYGNYKELYKALINGEIDLLAGPAKTPERDSLMNFARFPMGRDVYHLLKKSSDKILSTNPGTLWGKKVGVQKGYTEEVLRKFIENNQVQAEIIVYDTEEERNLALEEDEVQAIMIERIGFQIKNGFETFAKVGSSEYYLGVNKKRPDILFELNRALAQLMGADPIFMARLYETYIYPHAQNKHLRPEEKVWVDQLDTLKIGYLDNLLPYSARLEKGKNKPDGLIVDILSEIKKVFEIQKPFRYTAYDRYDDLVRDLNNGTIHVAFPIGGNLYHAEQSKIYLSNPIIHSRLDLVYKGDFEEKDPTLFAVNRNNTSMVYHINEYFPGAKIIEKNSIEECLRAVQKGEAQATVVGGLRSFQFLRDKRYGNLSVRMLNAENNKFFAVSVGNGKLLSLLNHGLAVIGEEYTLPLAYKHATKLYTPSLMDVLSKNMNYLIAIFILIAGIIFLLFYIRYRHIQLQASLEKEKNEQLSTQLDVIQSISDQYHSVFLVDIVRNTFKIIHTLPYIEKAIKPLFNDAQNAIRLITENMIQPRYRDSMREFNRIENWKKIPFNKNFISEEYEGSILGWCKASILVARRNVIGEPTLVIYTSQEINRQKNLELELKNALILAEKANNAKTNFLNNMSHDIRTPMNAIIGFTSLAATHINNKEKLTDYLDKIEKSSKHLLSLINDVLDMRRIESGRVKLEEKGTSLLELLQEVKSIVQTNAQMKQQELIFDVSQVKNEYILVDKLRLCQILLNLLSNAIKFTREKGHISLKVTEKTCQKAGFAHYELQVKDDGIGMSSEFQKHIFEAFSREEVSTVSRIQGTGIGMAITKKIVEMMMGTIEVHSVEDYGSEFTVNLEFQISDAKTTEQKIETKPQTFNGTRLLLAEDNLLNQEIAITILTEAGFKVDVAENGQEAVQKILMEPQDTYKVVLMDIQMPIMDGYEATRRIRHIPNSVKANIPIIAMTAKAFEEDRKKAYDIGMNGYIAKPIDITKLSDVLSFVLSFKEKKDG